MVFSSVNRESLMENPRAADGVADKSLSKCSAAVKATGNYKSRKRKQRKDELLISPGVILALDPHCCLRAVRFSILHAPISRFFPPWLRSSCRNYNFDLSSKYDFFFIIFYKISLFKLCIDLFIYYGKVFPY